MEKCNFFCKPLLKNTDSLDDKTSEAFARKMTVEAKSYITDTMGKLVFWGGESFPK